MVYIVEPQPMFCSLPDECADDGDCKSPFHLLRDAAD